MKKKLYIAFLLLLLAGILLLAGCETKEEAAEASGTAMIGNPWKSFSSPEEAEEAAGFPSELPQTVADSYTAETFRAMSGDAPLLEIVYRDGDLTVTVRKSQGEGRDISGLYGFDRTEECLWQDSEAYTVCREAEDGNALCILLDHDGYSWSLYAPNGFSGDSAEDFLTEIFS